MIAVDHYIKLSDAAKRNRWEHERRAYLTTQTELAPLKRRKPFPKFQLWGKRNVAR